MKEGDIFIRETAGGHRYNIMWPADLSRVGLAPAIPVDMRILFVADVKGETNLSRNQVAEKWGRFFSRSVTFRKWRKWATELEEVKGE